MPDLKTSLPKTRNKVIRQSHVQTRNQNALKLGHCFRILDFAEAFDCRPATLAQPPHKALFTKRIERVSGIDFWSGGRFQIRKGPFDAEKKTAFYKTNRPDNDDLPNRRRLHLFRQTHDFDAG